MCCPGGVGSRGAKAKRVILFDNGEITKWKLASAHIAMAHFLYKLLKFFKFVRRQAARAALGLESLQAPSGRQIGELHQRATQLARRRRGIRNDLLALEEFLQRLRALPAAPALDHLGGDLRRVCTQVIEQGAQQRHARLLAPLKPGALGLAHLSGDLRVRPGVGARFIFRNNDNPVGGPHEFDDATLVRVTLVPPGLDVAFPKQPVLGGVGGNPWISFQFLSGTGATLTDEYLLGRCVQLAKSI